jgi:hypothetical protein
MEPGKMMALMKAPWKSKTVSVKEPTKAGPTKLASRPMASQKLRTRAEPREIESRPMPSQKLLDEGRADGDLESTDCVAEGSDDSRDD